MILDTKLSEPLRLALQRLGRDRLQSALDALARAEVQEPLQLAAAEILKPDLRDFPVYMARDAHWLLDRRPGEQTWDEPTLRRLPELRASYVAAAKELATAFERQEWLVSLTAFTAGVMIPLLGRAGQHSACLELADAHYNLMLSEAYQDVGGAGSEVVAGQRHPQARLILLGPVLWSVVGHCRV